MSTYYLVIGLAVITGILVFYSGSSFEPLSFVKVWYGNAGVEVGDISESSAVSLGTFAIIGIIAFGTLILLFQNKKQLKLPKF